MCLWLPLFSIFRVRVCVIRRGLLWQLRANASNLIPTTINCATLIYPSTGNDTLTSTYYSVCLCVLSASKQIAWPTVGQ